MLRGELGQVLHEASLRSNAGMLLASPRLCKCNIPVHGGIGLTLGANVAGESDDLVLTSVDTGVRLYGESHN